MSPIFFFSQNYLSSEHLELDEYASPFFRLEHFPSTGPIRNNYYQYYKRYTGHTGIMSTSKIMNAFESCPQTQRSTRNRFRSNPSDEFVGALLEIKINFIGPPFKAN